MGRTTSAGDQFNAFKSSNVNEYIYAPVIGGYWKQHEIWDGTYNIDDLMDIIEMMIVKRENEIRASEAAKEVST